MEYGSDASAFIGLIKRHGYNKNIDVEIGRVQSVSPLIIDISSNITLDADDITVAERLTVTSPMEIGDLLIIISDHERDMFYAIDKVGVI
ncbi:MAG: DUF2577 family protein [Bacillota bacterium]